MANSLDEVTGPVNDAGRDVHVIDKQLSVEVGFGSTLFQIAFMGSWSGIGIVVCAVIG